MAAITAGTSPGTDPGLRSPVPARPAGPAAADRSPAAVRPDRILRSWPLLVLAAPAAAEVWSGWVGIAQKTGFGLVSPLPGICPSLHLDTAITLPVGVEAYAAYALRAWLARDHAISARTRRFARWSAIFSFALGMAGQIAYHLMAQAGTAQAPWPITTIVSCLPVLVLGMGTALAHLLQADAAAPDPLDSQAGKPGVLRSLSWSPQDQAGPPGGRRRETDRDRPARRDQHGPGAGTTTWRRDRGIWPAAAGPQADQARLIGRRLAAPGKPVSRRALRRGGLTGSNQPGPQCPGTHDQRRGRRERVSHRGQAGLPAQPEQQLARLQRCA
ncbi:MAG TPA: hypothetical protein VG123_28435 [Streptosporangiaceae bacterium]|nr:hypothetical protein [Streptosporangiaceae bacterium]